MPTGRPDHDAPVPLTPLSFHVLVALADAPLHGYGIIKEVVSLSDGRVEPATGTMYLALRRLCGDGLIAEADVQASDSRRRYYRITEEGRRMVAAEARRMARLVGTAVSRKLVGPDVLRVRE